MKNTLGQSPLMTPREIRAIEKEILSLETDIVHVLEWGSGGSTTHFTKFMRERGIKYSWTSLEYNKDWFTTMSEKVRNDPNISLHLFDVGNSALKQRSTDMEDYIKFPNTLNKKFNLIIVDGRKRRRCVMEAEMLLKNNGAVFLHDAQRPYYRCVFKEFPSSVLVGPFMWRGKRSSVSAIKKMLQKMQIQFWLLCFTIFIQPIFYFKRVIIKNL